MSAEESLKIDLMLELVTHLSSAQFAASYMQKDDREGGDPAPGSSRQTSLLAELRSRR